MSCNTFQMLDRDTGSPTLHVYKVDTGQVEILVIAGSIAQAIDMALPGQPAPCGIRSAYRLTENEAASTVVGARPGAPTVADVLVQSATPNLVASTRKGSESAETP